MTGTQPPTWRRAARRLIALPGVRLLAPGWPDAGRRVVQTPALTELLTLAATGGGDLRALNAGAGESLYTPLIRRVARPAEIVEFDMGPPPAGPRQACRFQASLTHIALTTASVDLAVCTEVLEHVPDDEQAVAELRRVLKAGGRLVLSVPTPPAVLDPAHVREGYTLEALRHLFLRHDLEIVEARYCMHRAFQFVLRHWRPRRVPLGAILVLAWLDRLFTPGPPMDLLVLARTRTGRMG